jgi:Flp pilus assembly protein TadG
MREKIRNFLKEIGGAGTVVAGLCLMIILGVAAIVVDIGHLATVKGELQRAADAGAMAGARALWPFALPIVNNPPASPDCANAQFIALSTATSASNQVDGEVLTAANLTIVVGNYNYRTKEFTPQPGCAANSNAVKVTAQKDINTIFFASIWNLTSMKPAATATGTMGFAKAVGKGSVPIAINQPSVKAGTTLYINFTPDPLDTGGWFADPPNKASAATFKDYIVNDSCPPLNVGDIITLQNGADSTDLTALQNELAKHPEGYWDIYAPVVNTDKFNQDQPIVGFVPFRITQVDNTGNSKGVTGIVLGLAESGGALPGSDVNYGVLAPPKEVN